MKIVYIDLKYDYGIKSRGLSPIGEKGFSQVFEKMGHSVACFYYDEYLQKLDLLQTELLKFVEQESPDVVYFSLYTNQFYPETLLKLKSKYKTIAWFGDDQFRFENFTCKYAPLFTYCVTTDPFAVPKYKKIGVQNVILSQWAALNIDVPAQRQEPKYNYDITFVGGAHSVRHWFIDEFSKAGLKVEPFGHRWPNGAVSLDKMIDIFQTSKINLNLSNSVNFDLRYLTHGWMNLPRALKSAKNVSQIKARNFEIPYYGGFQLTGYVPWLENYFVIGKEVACFTDVDEAILLAKFYLENDQIREDIKNASIERSRNMHTYLHRHEAVFSQI
jgi:spore maturation protein CgeB